ncbi:transposase [Roseospira visakhapatnamensis]|uniref:Transposase n=1 Tax=Roseospira visakhapatnamensis TaxID=390880 RepID=A0A7W6RDW3_9PROT|nr:transposase [Roseospira visakhapatnamensis]
MARGKTARKTRALAPIHPDAGAIDIGATMHMAAVPPDRDPDPVRAFATFTGDLHRLAGWFARCGVKTVAMESTGVSWIPVYEILEQQGFEVVLVNARDAKHVPGRKTDVSDAQWLRRLHEYGLVRGSFRPTGDLAALRAFLRHRERLLDYAAAHVQHMQKALTQMNLQLHHVVTDITGATGMRIIRAIVAGERDPAVLASYRDRRCRASEETIGAALVGNHREEHVFALAQALDLYDVYQDKVAACDARIDAVLKRLRALANKPVGTLPPPRHTAAERFGVRCPGSASRDPGRGPDPDPRTWPESGPEAGRGMRDGPLCLAQCKTRHVLALFGTQQQDFRRTGSVVADPPLQQSGRSLAPACRYSLGWNTDRLGRLLSAPRGPDR